MEWQIGQPVADIFKCMLWNENRYIWSKFHWNWFVPRGQLDNKWALVKVMAWRRLCDKPLTEPTWWASSVTPHVQWSAVITRSDIVRYYMNNYKKCVRISTRLWIHKRHPIPRPSGRVMGCPLRIFWENGPRYNGTALYMVTLDQNRYISIRDGIAVKRLFVISENNPIKQKNVNLKHLFVYHSSCLP